MTNVCPRSTQSHSKTRPFNKELTDGVQPFQKSRQHQLLINLQLLQLLCLDLNKLLITLSHSGSKSSQSTIRETRQPSSVEDINCTLMKNHRGPLGVLFLKWWPCYWSGVYWPRTWPKVLHNIQCRQTQDCIGTDNKELLACQTQVLGSSNISRPFETLWLHVHSNCLLHCFFDDLWILLFII